MHMVVVGNDYMQWGLVSNAWRSCPLGHVPLLSISYRNLIQSNIQIN